MSDAIVRKGDRTMLRLVGVIGASTASEEVLSAAFETGREVMRAGYGLICGGLGGVMEAACRGAHAESERRSGPIIAVLPGYSRADANPYVDIAITTGMGYARNSIIASSSDAVIAVSGGSGTLSEIAFAWQYGKPIVILRDLPGISVQLIDRKLDDRRNDRILGAANPREAVKIIKSLLGS
jgi:uncharacterized protein (TIGR00725 family)